LKAALFCSKLNIEPVGTASREAREKASMMLAASRTESRELHVVIAHPRDRDGEILIRHFQRSASRVDNPWPPRERLDAGAGLLLCLVSATTRPLLEAATARPGLPVVGIVDASVPDTLRLLNDQTPHTIMLRPVDPSAISPVVGLAMSLARQQRQELSKVAKLEDTLRSFRQIEQAKAILMTRRKMQEPAAYRFLRDEAMRRRISVGAVAAAIVRSHEVLPEAEE
jgi:AmiR/NasT family two-component response regulator